MTEILRKIDEPPDLYLLSLYELNDHLYKEFCIEDYAVEVDGELNGELEPEFVKHVAEITKGAIVDVKVEFSDNEWEYGFVFITMDGKTAYSDRSCLFLADEEGAFGETFFPDYQEMEERDYARHYRQEREVLQ